MTLPSARTDPLLGDIVDCPRCGGEAPVDDMWDDTMCLVCALDTGQVRADLDEADNLGRIRRSVPPDPKREMQ